MYYSQHLAVVKYIIIWVWTANKVKEVGKCWGGKFPSHPGSRSLLFGT